jgi:hypothetical protein
MLRQLYRGGLLQSLVLPDRLYEAIVITVELPRAGSARLMLIVS